MAPLSYYVINYLTTHSLTSERTGVDALTFRDIYLGAVHLIECRLAVRDVQESMATFPCGGYTRRRRGLKYDPWHLGHPSRCLPEIHDPDSCLPSSATPQITNCPRPAVRLVIRLSYGSATT